MDLKEKYIKNIVEANNNNNLAIFVGAGISKCAAPKLPDWNKLIEDLKKDLNESKENDPLKIAQFYWLAFGDVVYYKKLKAYFPDFIENLETHKLIFEINPHTIITTNWDNILEKTIEENAYLFDVISSDKDLAKSSLQNRLIKMHGDFKNHNIVFKENDYIDYQNNFPLIENYVKSILSTHTVVFLGYSYNDINLKQILKWIQHKSDTKPPMYLTINESNLIKEKYLENHGITAVIVKNNDINKFLKKIGNEYFNIPEITKSDDEVIQFVLKKLMPLDDLKGILVEQVETALTNGYCFYDSDFKPILQFHELVITKDINPITNRFAEILKKIDKEKKPNGDIIKIFKILNKAQIKGIAFDKTDKGSVEYIPFSDYLNSNEEKTIDEYLDFNFENFEQSTTDANQLIEAAFKLYNLEKWEDSYTQLEKAIAIYLKQRNFTRLFLTMFNRNNVLKTLQHPFHSYREKYSEVTKYNLKQKYSNLPKYLQKIFEPIYKITDFSFLYEYAYNVDKDLQKKEDSKRLIERGVFFWCNSYEIPAKHQNLLNFVLKNQIIIEHYEEYCNINKKFVEIAIIRQVQKKIISLNKTEIYSCIKYIEYKKLEHLLTNIEKGKVKLRKLQIAEENKNWLINVVFKNTTNQYLKSKNYGSRFKNYTQKTLFILSLLKHTEEEVKIILSIISKIISEAKNTISIFQSIDTFLAIQFNLYGLNISKETLLSIIEDIINRLVSSKVSLEREYNELSNLYGYAREMGTILTNEDLIDKLLNEMKNYETSDKINIGLGFLLRLYNIANKEIKEKIKAFLLTVDSKKEKEKYQKIIFDLALIRCGFKKAKESNIQEIERYIRPYKDKNFSTALYPIYDLLNYLVNNKKIKDFNGVYKSLKKIIERIKNEPSFF